MWRLVLVNFCGDNRKSAKMFSEFVIFGPVIGSWCLMLFWFLAYCISEVKFVDWNAYIVPAGTNVSKIYIFKDFFCGCFCWVPSVLFVLRCGDWKSNLHELSMVFWRKKIFLIILEDEVSWGKFYLALPFQIKEFSISLLFFGTILHKIFNDWKMRAAQSGRSGIFENLVAVGPYL